MHSIMSDVIMPSLHLLFCLAPWMPVSSASQRYLYKGDPESRPIIEYHHTKVKTELSPNAWSSLKEKFSENATDDEIRRSVDPDYYTLNLPKGTICVVEFYAPWCPHCQAWKPKYIQIAKDILGQSTGQVPIAFYAVSCVAYPMLCNAYAVDGYPTIFGFPILSTNDSAKTERDSRYSNLPKPKRHTHDDPYEISSTINDLGALSRLLGFALATHKDAKRIKTYENETHQMEWEAQFEELAKSAIERARTNLEYPKRLEDIYRDAAFSVTFILEHGVYNRPGPLQPERRLLLSEFLELISWAVPSDWGYMPLIHDLRNEFETIIQGRKALLAVLSRNEDTSYWGMVGGLDLLHSSHQRSVIAKAERGEEASINYQWSEACTHGQAGFGYTCGLWEFFHIVTVGFAEQYYNGLRNGNAVSTKRTADILRNFIHKFFSCVVCRNNFVSAYDSCIFDLCTRLSMDFPSHDKEARELPLWLWEMHNGVNVRLIQERAEELEWRNVTTRERAVALFPSELMCPECRTKVNGSSSNEVGAESAKITPPEDIKWSKDDVYMFLRDYYWPGGQDLYPRLLKLNAARGEIVQHNSSFQITAKGPALAALLSVGSFLGIVVHIFLRRRTLAKSGSHKKYDDLFLA